MAFQDPPYAVEKTDHTARLFRRQFQQAVGAGSGVSRPGDLKVLPLNQPGNGFRVAPGGGIAQSRDTASSARESYGPVNNEEIVITGVPGTGSGQTRRDLVILEITNPAMESVSYPEPTDPEYTGGWLLGSTFARITVIPGVFSAVKSLDQITTGPYRNVTGVTLAAINWPANTTTISAGMIEDLRRVHRPEIVPGRVGSTTPPTAQNLTATAFARWISSAEWPLQIPDGATFVDLRFDVLNAIHMVGDVYGTIGLFVDGELAASGPYAADWTGAQTRQSVFSWGKYRIPPEKAGKTVTFDLRAFKNEGSPGYLRADAQTRAVLDYRFLGEAA